MFPTRPRRSAVLIAPLVLACLLPRLAPAQQSQTIAAVALSGYQNVLDDVGYVGGLIEMPQLAVSIEGMVGMFTAQKGLVGLDKSRPWGVLLQSSGQDLSPLVCLPVTDLNGLLAVAEPLGVLVEDAGEGVKSVSVQGQTYFVKATDEWVFAAQQPNQLESLPADPAGSFSGLVSEYDLGVRLFAQNVPPMYKQLALGQLRAGMEEGLQRKPEETDAQFETRREMALKQIESIELLINDLQQATIGLSVNPDNGGLEIDFRGTAAEGTKLADQLAIYNATGTKLGGFLKQGATMSVASAYQIPADVLPRVSAEYDRQMADARAAFDQLLDEAEFPNQEVRDTVESALEDLLSSVEVMVRSGEVDMVGSLTLEAGAASGLGALRTPDPGKIDSAIKKLAALAEGDPNLPAFNWDAETHEGVTLHTLSAPVDNPQAALVLGPLVEVAVGIGSDGAYFAFGPDGIESVKAAITASSSGVTEVKPVEMTIAMAPLMEFSAALAEATGQDAAVPMMFASLLKESDSADIDITVDGQENGLRYRVRVEEGVLKAIGKTAIEMQRSQMPR